MSEEIKKQKGHFSRNWFFYLLLVAALSFSSYLWISKNTALKKQAKIFTTEKTALMEEAQKTFETDTNKHLELMMNTFVWAVRSEMTRGNLEQVGQYFNQLVQAENISEITLVDKNRKILLTTNKKNEGNLLPQDYGDNILNVDQTTVINRDSVQLVVAPVMSVDSRLATLFLIWNGDK